MHVCTKPYVLYVNECQMFVVSVNILKSAQTSVFDVYVCAYVMAEECAFHKQWKLYNCTICNYLKIIKKKYKKNHKRIPG